MTLDWEPLTGTDLKEFLYPELMHKRLYLALLLLLAGCVADPIAPIGGGSDTTVAHGVIVVNEGVWFQDNASLTRYDPLGGRVIQDYFTLINPGRRLGDLANDIFVWKNRAFITVTTSQTIEVIEIPSGRSAGRIVLPPGSDPRSTLVVDDSTGFVTNLKDDSVVEFDPRTLTIVGRIAVGPSPEGVAAVDSLLYVANSGYGILRQDEPGAGTLSIVDIGRGVVRDSVDVGENPQSVRYLRSTGKLYVLYGLPESAGGVAELDPRTLTIERRWLFDGTRDHIAIDTERGILYAIGTRGLWKIDPAAAGSTPALLLESASYTNVGFYAVGVAPAGDIHVAYTRGFTIPGAVIVVNPGGAPKNEYPVGLNPGAFGFY